MNTKIQESPFEQEQQCWTQTDLELLRDRGQATGLTGYLKELKNHLWPVIKHSA